MKVVFELDKLEPDFKRRRIQDSIVKAMGTKIIVRGNTIHTEVDFESTVEDLLIRSGLKFKKLEAAAANS
ncbi:hypothetical protein [Peredibacter starrii]|uniref:Uncharacterized protein n=1 Tax=Peredibacter starrii TaxID=28202 RepID=A0AAX4HTG5_9BACT|nr:hypothetical protein [Peredibacter starrii]WPU66681.1 hypothetical protein SOO65_07975 [Peredibacter starrii]